MRRIASILAATMFASGLLYAGPALAATLPPDLPLPTGVSADVRYEEFGRDDFSYATAAGPWVHPVVAGHTWRAFLRGDAAALSVASWTRTLSGAGWDVVRQTEGNLVAHHAAWWVKVGTDRLVLVQEDNAAAFTLTPPGATPETLVTDHDIPYAAPLPGSRRAEWATEEHFELTPKQDPQLLLLGPAVRVRYEGAASLSGLEIQTRYADAFAKAGWQVVRTEVGGVTGAHYGAHGRDVWAKVTPFNGAYVIETADVGAAAAASALARTLAAAGHVALYGIYFDTDKATLKPESEATLQQVRALLVADPKLALEVQGHTDDTSTPAHNQPLSEARAASVRAWLVAHGIDGARLTPKGYAATKPVADNATPQGRALNRRVELAKR